MSTNYMIGKPIRLDRFLQGVRNLPSLTVKRFGKGNALAGPGMTYDLSDGRNHLYVYTMNVDGREEISSMYRYGANDVSHILQQLGAILRTDLFRTRPRI